MLLPVSKRRKSDGSGGGPVFDTEFAQDAFDVLADRSGACAEDDADLMVRFTLCDPGQNLRFARGETQRIKRVFSFCFGFVRCFGLWSFHLVIDFLPSARADLEERARILVPCSAGSKWFGSCKFVIKNSFPGVH